MIMELLEGGQLFDLFKQKYVFKNTEIQIILKKILEALAYLH